jgi:hypothetical protein
MAHPYAEHCTKMMPPIECFTDSGELRLPMWFDFELDAIFATALVAS